MNGLMITRMLSAKFQNKYRIESARLRHWDYGSNAAYFVTICTQDRVHYFGDIIDRSMCLSEIGKIVTSEWMKTPEIRPDMNLGMGEYVVMPNHFHAIIVIGENKYNHGTQARDAMHRRDAMHCVSTVGDDANQPSKNQFGPQSKNLASIIRGFKSSVTKNARLIHADFAWQPRYHDHVIRDQKSFDHIANYIRTNPLNWSKDQFAKATSLDDSNKL